MKVTIELNDYIIDAIAQTQANNVALSWWDACGIEETHSTPQMKETIKILYKNAFGDGIRFISDCLNAKQ